MGDFVDAHDPTCKWTLLNLLEYGPCHHLGNDPSRHCHFLVGLSKSVLMDVMLDTELKISIHQNVHAARAGEMRSKRHLNQLRLIWIV